MKTSKEYRLEAKAALKGNWGYAIAIVLLFSAAIGALSATFVGGIVLTGALMIGYAYAMIQFCRRGSFKIEDLLQGLKTDNFTATIGLYVKMTIFIFLWSLLFCIPGIIKSYAYSMAPYIMADHPNITGGQAITASQNLMKGKKAKLFCLHLSFIGWILLCVLTFGILTIWVGPWMEVAQARFYESIKDEVQL